MVNTAVILAGGFGTRLQTVVADLPKPMAPVNGQPFLDYQLNYLKHQGIKKAILSLGHLAQKVQDHYKNSFHGIEIMYVVEESPLGTGGAIRAALERVFEKEVLVLNGDSFFDIDLQKFYNLHQNQESKISLALRRVNNASRYGTIQTNNDNRIISFKEKNSSEEAGTINAGIYLLDRELYLSLTSTGAFSIEKDFFEKQLDQIVINGFGFDGYFIDIGIPEDYAKAQHDFKGFKYR